MTLGPSAIGLRLAALLVAGLSFGAAPAQSEDVSNDAKYDKQGHVDFVSAQIDLKTDTQTVRAVILNEAATKFQVKLVPGQYVPVNLIADHQPDALSIPEAALGRCQIHPC